MRNFVSLALLVGCSAPAASNGDGDSFRLRARRGADLSTLEWKAAETAVVICDMWDDHWCKGAARRCGELARPLNEFARAARARGALIAHAPSDTMKFYAGTPQRKRAQEAPAAKAPSPITSRRIEPSREPKLPIDDSDNGCDDQPRCKPGPPWPWTRQHAAIEIANPDVITDSGQELYNVCRQRGIRNVIVCGVHTNMCVLGRSFAIRQMVLLGMNVVLVRDLTDSLYNPRMAPFVSHERGTELVIEHIEKYWCPSILSGDVSP